MRKPIATNYPDTMRTSVMHADYEACMRILKDQRQQLTQDEADCLAFIAGDYATGYSVPVGDVKEPGVLVKTLRRAHSIISRFEPMA